ncbi:MAG: DUF4141 domain-containing protein [Alistipes sp.]|jgi:predicted adenine nucleotide alpha hydrolase (AANH) superfamily ATPase|nr:DUF4141 domain-containing protein [Alistipes sp.]
MRKSILILAVAIVGFAGRAHAQWVVTDPINIATSIVNSANQIVQTSSTVANVIKNFKEVQKVYEQGKEYYDKLRAVNNLVKDAKKVRDAILLVGEIGDIYVKNYQKMLSDPHFRYEELVTISNGYTMLLSKSADMIKELKEVVNPTTMSMTDRERMEVINEVHDKLCNHRNLVNYYTRKNISVSYLRARKAGDTDRVMALYGNANERYW